MNGGSCKILFVIKKKEEEKIITAGGVSFQSTIDLSFITLSLKK